MTNVSHRLPPNQQLVAPGKWPLVGEREPANSTALWTVAVDGEVERPLHFTLDELRALPSVERSIDIHCVTRWSKLDAPFRGALLADLLERAIVRPNARFVSFVARSERNHSTSLALAEAIELGAMVAWEADGAPLARDHGGPVRVVTPGRYFYKSLKWLVRIELLAEDRLGYWESDSGYHNHADPWREERFLAPCLSLHQMRAVLATRDLSGRDLRGLAAEGRELAGLNARDALLRDADFRRADLQHACFDRANLSNARFQGANLRGASFRDADLEGADCSGADLRGVDLRGASLFGASFGGDPRHGSPALLDAATRIDRAAIDQLTPWEERLVRTALNIVD